MAAAARALVSGTRQEADLSGVVRLATAETFATHLLLPEIGRLRRAHPRLSLDILTDITSVNLHRRDADLALRMVRPERGNVSVQRLGQLGYGLYAAPAYLEGRPAGAEAAGFAADSFIGWAEAQAHLPAARWLEQLLQGQRVDLATSSLATQLAACLAGQGLAVLPHFLAGPRLVCLRADLGLAQDIWLVDRK